MNKLIGWGIGLIVALALVLLLNPFVQVSTGERAVVTHFGAVSGELGPGIHWLTPITTGAVVMNVQTQKEQTTATAASKDLQQVTAEIAVNYNVDPTKVTDLFTKVGTSYKSTIIDPAIQEVVKQVTANYTAEELITKRTQVTADMEEALTTKLLPTYINVTAVNVTNFDFSAQFNTAVESKVTAQQNAQAEQNNLTAAQFKAQAIKITSEAANNEKYIQLQQLEVEKAAIAQWNGVLPTQMIPGATLPFINLSK